MKTLEKAYKPQKHEDTLYRRWEESGFFNPDVCIEKGVTKKDAKPFCTIMPPPNVTGHLHIGHAAMLAIEDTMVRFARMQGKKTLWIPGTDHAAIATQEKVERLLWESEKKNRHDIGREDFLKRVHIFAQESHDRITHQVKKMGSSLDWSREAFTLDEKRHSAVNTAFKKMYDDGIIYRGDRIVNWDPKMQTTVSDDEIEWKEETIPFYYFQYGPFVIGTSRPETKFGDKYIVVHPDDTRYDQYQHGQTFEVQWIGDTKITATLIKDNAVDPEFGSGAMTITPWHDATDFEIAERHHLDKEQIIGYDGKMLSKATGEDFHGLDIFEARKKIVEKLNKKGLLVKKENNYVHNIAINSRGGGVIEPQIKRQWFVSVNKTFERHGKNVSLKQLMQNAVREKEIDILPERFEKIYFHWIDNLRDWCISRQIWYGHQIPVWYRNKEIYCDTKAPNGEGWEQDPDTLDTWFSSGLWTFSTLGWPEKTQDLETYHPTSVLETGYDILFFWVARMILMSTYLLDEIPFKTTYLHGLVRDEKGRKMSKSIGNVIDPLDVIRKYGTDAVRLSLLLGNTPGNDIRLSDEKIATYRNFTNKLWNIARFIASRVPEEYFTSTTPLPSLTLDSSYFIITEMEKLIQTVTHDLDQYRFSQAGEKLRDFTWNILADWYVEITKFEENREETHALLAYILLDLLRLWHPFMPFVTEAIWTHLGRGTKEKDMLMVSSWPKVLTYQKALEKKNAINTKDFETLIEIIKTIRNLRNDYKIEVGKYIPIILSFTSSSDSLYDCVQRNIHLITSLRTHVNSVSLEIAYETKESCISESINTHLTLFISQKDCIDTDKEKERLKKEIASLTQYEQSLEKQLNNGAFIENAPEHIVQGMKKKFSKAQAQRLEHERSLEKLM